MESKRSKRRKHLKNRQFQNVDVRSLFESAKSGNVTDFSNFLSENSVKELDKCFDDQGNGLFHWICLQGHTNLVKLLIYERINLNLKTENEIGKQPIHWACANGHLPVVALLLIAGVDINAADDTKATPFLIASQYGHTLLVNYLVNKGANIYVKDHYGNTALHWAAFKGHEELCSYLGFIGLQANETDNGGNTVLHLAVKNGGFWTVNAILNRFSVDLRALNSEGESVLNLASHLKKKVVYRALKQRLSISTQYDDFKNFVFGPPGKSTFGIWFFVLNVIFWGYPMYFYHALPTTWNDIMFVHMSFFFFNILMWGSFFSCRTTQPGFIRTSSKSYYLLVQQVKDLENEIIELVHGKGIDLKTEYLKSHPHAMTHLCHTCRCVRPIRSKHCRKCDRCVMNFDHHCPYIGTCIGINNRPYFFTFALCILINCIVATYICHITIHKLGWCWLYIFGFVQICIFSFLSITLMLFMIYYITQNLTTNEIMNYKKYDYLKDSNTGKFCNPFHKGIVRNVLSYFTCIPSLDPDQFDLDH